MDTVVDGDPRRCSWIPARSFAATGMTLSIEILGVGYSTQ
jgi:hypothetical protein